MDLCIYHCIWHNSEVSVYFFYTPLVLNTLLLSVYYTCSYRSRIVWNLDTSSVCRLYEDYYCQHIELLLINTRVHEHNIFWTLKHPKNRKYFSRLISLIVIIERQITLFSIFPFLSELYTSFVSLLFKRPGKRVSCPVVSWPVQQMYIRNV